MRPQATGSGSWLRELLEPPHPALLEAGAGGERLVANTRLVFWIFIGLAPMSSAITARGETPLEVWIALGGVMVAIALSILVIFLLRSAPRINGIGFATGAADVTIVSVVLFAVALAGRPQVAAQSQVAWAVYLLGIVATCLRFDVRICMFVGAVAFFEYLAFVLWVSTRMAAPVTRYDVLLQIARLAMMLAATAVAVGIVHRSRRLVRASGTDRLTGLASRAYFEERFAAELSRSARGEAPLALALFDIDRFKQFNDQFGHEAGDRALKLVARVLNREQRKQDFLARWGGEELALILPDTGVDGACQTVERIRRRLGRERLPVKDQRVALTVSVGVAEFPTDGADTESLFVAADRRLFAAKREGRDRVVCTDREN